MKTFYAFGLIAACALTACASATTAGEREARRQQEIAARQGEEVDRICFTRNINGWREFGDDAVLLERNVNDWYLVELRGTCRPDESFTSIGLQTRGGSCLTRGDNILTPEATLGGRCFVDRMYEWDEDVEIEPAADEEVAARN